MGKTQYGTLPEVHKKHRIYSYLLDSVLLTGKINSFFLSKKRKAPRLFSFKVIKLRVTRVNNKKNKDKIKVPVTLPGAKVLPKQFVKNKECD